MGSGQTNTGVKTQSEFSPGAWVVLDPSTFEPVVSFLTRYGYVELSNSASSLGNAGDYLAKIAINTTNLSFI